jgi:hypothetical protein
MDAADAVTLLLNRFPAVRERVDQPDDLFEMPHVTYGLLATDALENSDDVVLLDRVANFVDELANSGDELLEELLVVDVLEGIAQQPNVASGLRMRISPRAASFLEMVEREYFGRLPQ